MLGVKTKTASFGKSTLSLRPHEKNILSSDLLRLSKRQRLQELLLALKTRLARPSPQPLNKRSWFGPRNIPDVCECSNRVRSDCITALPFGHAKSLDLRPDVNRYSPDIHSEHCARHMMQCLPVPACAAVGCCMWSRRRLALWWIVAA